MAVSLYRWFYPTIRLFMLIVLYNTPLCVSLHLDRMWHLQALLNWAFNFIDKPLSEIQRCISWAYYPIMFILSYPT